ncbi:MAG: hypothetical protein COC15_03845 [Legionellales bacterium]|nr:MAG: hypothetical protein COC15_03845 [Legionellales bacterium]
MLNKKKSGNKRKESQSAVFMHYSRPIISKQRKKPTDKKFDPNVEKKRSVLEYKVKTKARFTKKSFQDLFVDIKNIIENDRNLGLAVTISNDKNEISVYNNTILAGITKVNLQYTPGTITVTIIENDKRMSKFLRNFIKKLGERINGAPIKINRVGKNNISLALELYKYCKTLKLNVFVSDTVLKQFKSQNFRLGE